MINLGLSRISRLLGLLAKQKGIAEYQPPWKAIHIAGTNGKGSVAAYVSALLNLTSHHIDHGKNKHHKFNSENSNPNRTLSSHTVAAEENVTVGRFTSPHFIDSWDCIKINDDSAPYAAFERTMSKVISLATQVERELLQEISGPSTPTEQAQQDTRLTEFELLTATAFELFSDPEFGPCDVSVVECGLGGRLDATNALPDSVIQLSVITRIGLDHLDILGGSLQSIIREKCGILREDVPVVIDGDNSPEVLRLIRHETAEKFSKEQIESRVHFARAQDIDELIEQSIFNHGHNQSVDIVDRVSSHSLDLMPHQKSNLAIALKVCELLYGTRITATLLSNPTSLLDQVFQQAARSYPGRLQWLESGELTTMFSTSHLPNLGSTKILLDGAHNAQSASVLRACVDKELQKTTLVPQSIPESVESVYDDFAELSTESSHSNLNAASPNSTFTSHASDTPVPPLSGAETTPRKVIWILAMSSSKDVFDILETLVQSSNDEIIFTTFGPVQGMPWVRPTSLASLVSSSEVLDLQYHIKATVTNIVEALDAADGIIAKHTNLTHHPVSHQPQQSPLLVIAGSLYLVSDFLRFQRDGREAFLKYRQTSTESIQSTE